MAKTTVDKQMLNFIREQVKIAYPKQVLGNCYEINSTVAYFLHNLGYKTKIIQGNVILDKEIYDKILEENIPETKGITQYPDHIWIKVWIGKARRIYDFAKDVFGGAKILHFVKVKI